MTNELMKALFGKVTERMFEREIELLKQSWFRQDRAERKARLAIVQELVRELDRIRAVSRFATALGEGAIEAVIIGDWPEVTDWAESFRFADEPAVTDDIRDLWMPFRMTLMLAATRAQAPNAPKE